MLALLEQRELPVQDLVRILGIAQSTVSRHLATLKEAGLVHDRRQTTYTYYRFGLPEDGEWADAWSLVRRGLADDPVTARDSRTLEAMLRARSVRSESWFDQLAPEWDALREVFRDDLQRARAINKLLTGRMKVCEIGTGTGVLAADLARCGIQVIAVDHAERMLDAARAKLDGESFDAGVEFRRGDANALPLEDGEVDAAMAHMVLHYLQEPISALREMARVVRPGGRIVVVDFLHHDMDWMRRDLGVYWQGFSRDQVESWLADVGLESIEIDVQPADRGSLDLPTAFIATAVRGATERAVAAAGDPDTLQELP